ncbi:sigma-E processing peptidase SpoIIGA [Desulfuribacillus stibiiarsenatis]|uniref:Sigma-E processing peptidase SpoIIGA n=1 Tax=Desulfuribacillus stibiiarsenatis TaxID=1390249 RepID=A0A1E5L3N2_9FIRM|nr:sigma-E processing peptidase SpoIIGA [Desulfuribacillus stibiiarsenatis]OEH84717.1 sigma-E processing peptidase SpoIIGA [Desulfuribacillus stibiiarsenatis]
MESVYLDILFLVNFIIDLSLLCMTAYYRNIKNQWLRMVSAAVIGACYGSAWVLYQSPYLFSFAAKIIFSFLLIRIAFSWRNWQTFLQLIVSFYLINFIAAGAIFAVQYMLLSQQKILSQWIRIGNQNVWVLETTVSAIVFGLPLAYLGFRSFWKNVKKQLKSKSWIYTCTIYYKGKVNTFNGLLDTGNQLADPISSRPVSIVEYQKVENMIPSFVNTLYADGSLNIADLPRIFQKISSFDNFTLIPYRGMGSENKYLLAFKPDCFQVTTKEGVVDFQEGYIGITTQVLSVIGDYSAIIHPDFLEGEIRKREETTYENANLENQVLRQT